MLKKKQILNNGVEIPVIGLGTWQVDNDAAYQSVTEALKVGYIHIDSARLYQNEEGVGRAIKDSNVARKDIFVTTKILRNVKTYQEAYDMMNESLKLLDMEYVDLVLIHWPTIKENPNRFFKENVEVYRAMEDFLLEGKTRAIGLSNFEIEDVENILANCKIKPQVNQIRVHIGHVPMELIRYCQERDILVQAYSPNATGHLVGHDEIEEMAKKYNVSVPQLGIRFDYQLGLNVLPKTTHREYMIENADIDFEISDADMQKLLMVEEISSKGPIIKK